MKKFVVLLSFFAFASCIALAQEYPQKPLTAAQMQQVLKCPCMTAKPPTHHVAKAKPRPRPPVKRAAPPREASRPPLEPPLQVEKPPCDICTAVTKLADLLANEQAKDKEIEGQLLDNQRKNDESMAAILQTLADSKKVSAQAELLEAQSKGTEANTQNALVPEQKALLVAQANSYNQGALLAKRTNTGWDKFFHIASLGMISLTNFESARDFGVEAAKNLRPSITNVTNGNTITANNSNSNVANGGAGGQGGTGGAGGSASASAAGGQGGQGGSSSSSATGGTVSGSGNSSSSATGGSVTKVCKQPGGC